MSTIPRLPDPKLKIEAAFVEYVKVDPAFAPMQVVPAADRSVEVETPYVFCAAQALEPRGNGHYVVKMQVSLVTNITDTPAEERQALAGKLLARMQPASFASASGEVAVLGWSWPVPREAADGQEAGDALLFTAGVQVPG